jgi:hypothetical protein
MHSLQNTLFCGWSHIKINMARNVYTSPENIFWYKMFFNKTFFLWNALCNVFINYRLTFHFFYVFTILVCPKKRKQNVSFANPGSDRKKSGSWSANTAFMPFPLLPPCGGRGGGRGGEGRGGGASKMNHHALLKTYAIAAHIIEYTRSCLVHPRKWCVKVYTTGCAISFRLVSTFNALLTICQFVSKKETLCQTSFTILKLFCPISNCNITRKVRQQNAVKRSGAPNMYLPHKQ